MNLTTLGTATTEHLTIDHEKQSFGFSTPALAKGEADCFGKGEAPNGEALAQLDKNG